MPLLVGGQKLVPEQLRGQVEPAELIQQTFECAITSFAQFRGSTEPELLMWLRQILKSQSLNAGRHFLDRQKRDASRQVSLDDEALGKAWRDVLPDDDATPYTSTSRRERYEIMNRAFGQLKEEHRTVIELRHGSKLSFAEIAKQLGKSPEAVTKTWKRALQAWRRAMEELGLREW